MSKLSGIRDLDREIFAKVDDIDLLKICSIDKYTWNNVCDDGFLRRRLLSKYPEIQKYKLETESWKKFFLRATNYISNMKEKFNYDYTSGNFVMQYDLLDRNYKNYNALIFQSCAKGELAIVIWSLKAGADIHFQYDAALGLASGNGYLDIVKYLVENGADFKSQSNYPLRRAAENGQLETVKYLVEVGADIHAHDDIALRLASMRGYLDTVKYLVEVGANVHAQDDYALKSAKYSEIVHYLKSKM